MNRPQLVAYRRELRLHDAAHETQSRLFERLQQLEQEVANLTAHLRELESGEPNT